MIRWFITFALASGLQFAMAQDDMGAAPESPGMQGASAMEFVTHRSGSFGFSISVPANGLLRTPEDPDWRMDPEIAMVWEGESGPVSLVELRVDSIGSRITPEQFDEFYQALLSNWLAEGRIEDGAGGSSTSDAETAEAAPDAAGAGAEGESAEAPRPASGKSPKYVVTRANEPPYRFGNMDWSIIEVIDSSHETGDKVYYSIFATYYGESIYTIGFYYLSPVTKEVQDMAVPMMKSFNVLN